MFVNECTVCQKRQLILPSQITGMTSAAEGFALTYTCWCGADQVWYSAGTPADAPRHTVAA